MADSSFPSVQTWHGRGAPLLIADVQISACNQSWIQLKLFISCSPIVINCNTNQWLMTSFINAASIITRIHVRVISWASQGMDIQWSFSLLEVLEFQALKFWGKCIRSSKIIKVLGNPFHCCELTTCKTNK